MWIESNGMNDSLGRADAKANCRPGSARGCATRPTLAECGVSGGRGGHSEDPGHPIEAALLPRRGSGWRAAEPGRQAIRLLFTSPQRLRRIWLVFAESTVERTQEYVLRWSSDGGQPFHEIVRQQWNFSPQGATRETEDYRVGLSDVAILDLSIIPDTSGKIAFASLVELRIA